MNLNRLAQGVAQPGLSVGRVNQEDFILPPIDLQKQFASKIEVIEKQKELIKQSIQEAETLFNSRMDYYFN
jgi:type I restriction enzyme S subunit